MHLLQRGEEEAEVAPCLCQLDDGSLDRHRPRRERILVDKSFLALLRSAAVDIILVRKNITKKSWWKI